MRAYALLLTATTALTLAAPAAAADFDHSLLDGVLSAHVKGDGVDYAGLKGNADLKAYVAKLAAVDPSALPSDKARLAFWINAYNALTLTGVLRHWPGIKSVSNIKPDFGFFKAKDFVVGGKPVSLNQIENEIIRPTFKEPRIHAALNCASVACPPLLNQAFTAAKLDAQLDTVFGRWVNDSKRNRLDAKGLQVSEIFKWYAADFKAGGGVKAWLAKYATGANKAAVQAAPDAIGYLPYDWNLNTP